MRLRQRRWISDEATNKAMSELNQHPELEVDLEEDIVRLEPTNISPIDKSSLYQVDVDAVFTLNQRNARHLKLDLIGELPLHGRKTVLQRGEG